MSTCSLCADPPMYLQLLLYNGQAYFICQAAMIYDTTYIFNETIIFKCQADDHFSLSR